MERKRVLLAWGGIAVVAAVAALVIFRSPGPSTPRELLRHLPAQNAPVLSVDFEALRRSGILALLAAAKVDQEPEYKTFVAKTAFDYSRDLDRALLAFHSSGVYFLLHGRFDWLKLEAYAREQGGSCVNSLCRMPGSSPDRRISFFLLRRDLMALAVSADDWAASKMSEPSAAPPPIFPPSEPVWLFLPQAALRKADSFPTGTQLFVKAMEDAESLTLSLGTSGPAIEARLDVLCPTAREAALLATTLERITKLLRDLIAREKTQPKPGDFAQLLMSGVFQQQDRHVSGKWPVDRALIESLAGRPAAP
ncbi:MAG: hypothetical protein HYR60_15755 [Acidobacteria bacterium]|nr:hypothetical protein [Acidobacteriota bacterium]